MFTQVSSWVEGIAADVLWWLQNVFYKVRLSHSGDTLYLIKLDVKD